jgi:hypothetical protein
MTTLFINRNDSRCGKCNKNADPSEIAHEMAHMVGQGCGTEFASVSSDYCGIDVAVKAMRPDLEFLDPLAGLSGWGTES